MKMVYEELKDEQVEETQTITDPGWNEYVLSHLLDEEKDDKGNPKVDGLRRICELLLGPIKVSESSLVTLSDKTVVKHTMTIDCIHTDNYLRTFSDIADAYEGNVSGIYTKHITAVAATRAEGRVLRKLLRLRQVVAAEELEENDKEDLTDTQPMSNQQQHLMKNVSERNGIDLDKLIKYMGFEKVTRSQAAEVGKQLAKYQSGEEIPEEIKK